MAISLKEFNKTEYVGVYESKESILNKGYKYLGRFQYSGKKYMKVLGYSIKDNMTQQQAYEILNEYKDSVKEQLDTQESNAKSTKQKSTQESIPQKDSYIVLDDEPVSLDDILNEYKRMKAIVGDYLPMIEDTELLSDGIQKIYESEVLKQYQTELIKLQNHLEDTNKKMIILFEGRDASGKGGAIRRITRYMNNKHYRVVALGKPTDEQKTQWFFQRYIEHFPRGGEVILFDRSWYNRAMVEPVFGFCTDREYKIFMEDVGGFEKDLVRQDIILIKLYFSVSKEEQLRRFDRRKTDPLRQWKLSEVDLQAQDLWEEFSEKKYKMLQDTHTIHAPWHIIRSDNKHLARLEAMKIILNSVDYSDRNSRLDYNYNKDIYVPTEQELEDMKKSGNF
jgi:polyphosphate kinase 2